MKVGILTYHKAHNYGAVFQAFALKKYLIELGHEVKIINYWPEYRDGMYDLFDLRFIKKIDNISVFFKGLMGIIKSVVCMVPKNKRIKKFDDFISKFLVESSKVIRNGKDLGDDYDIYVYGSDQIWRYNTYVNCIGYDDVYWGDYPICYGRKKIAYSASMGIINDNEETIKQIKNKIKNFSAVSVRETSLKNYLNSVVSTPIQHTIDPVLLINKRYYIEIMDKNVVRPKKYVLLYNLNYSSNAIKIAKQIAVKYHLEVVELTYDVRLFEYRKNIMHTVGPKEFISLLYYSDIVVSTSFHGVVFSLVFEKQFYALDMGNNSARVKDMLHSLGIKSRYINEKNNYEDLSDIDYLPVNKKLDLLREKSRDFILQNLY